MQRMIGRNIIIKPQDLASPEEKFNGNDIFAIDSGPRIMRAKFLEGEFDDTGPGLEILEDFDPSCVVAG